MVGISESDVDKCLSLLRYVSYEDYVLTEDINTPIDCIKAIRDWMLNLFQEHGVDTSYIADLDYWIAKLQYVYVGDLVTITHHNRLVDAIKKIRNILYDVSVKYGVPLTYVSQIDQYVQKLQYVRSREIIEPDHHNSIVDALKAIRLVLPDIVSNIKAVSWSMFQYDYKHAGQTSVSPKAIYLGAANGTLVAVNPDGSIKWKSLVSSQFDASSPVVAPDGTIYIGDKNGYVIAVNPDGTVKWAYLTGGAVYSTPAIASDGTIYVGSSDNYVYAFNPDGSLKWRFLTGGEVRSSPTIAPDGSIYVASDDHYLYAFNPDGSLKWRVNIGGVPSYSVAVDDNGVAYVGSDNNTLYAINPDGTVKWTYQANYPIQASPAIAPDGTIVFADIPGTVYALRPDGSLKWYTNTLVSPAAGLAIDKNGIIYVTGFKGVFGDTLYAINPDGYIIWTYNIPDPYYGFVPGAPAIDGNNTIYIGAANGTLYALNPDGTVKWSSEILPPPPQPPGGGLILITPEIITSLAIV